MNMLRHERALWAASPKLRLAGVDEAGRGPLAGPVVAAAVCIPAKLANTLYDTDLNGLTDSKRLTASLREKYFALLTTHPGIQFGIGIIDATEIDQINILNATWLAMRRAVENLPVMPGHVLVDGLPVKGLPCPSTAIVKGDSKSLLIAAASVLAKVTRDRLMAELDRAYPVYGFAANKGYGTAAHIRALRQYGPCPQHRRTFRPVADILSFFPGFE